MKTWDTLKPLHLNPERLERVDPYLRLADGTGYVDHGGTIRKSHRVGVSVELSEGCQRPKIRGLRIPDEYPSDGRYFTAEATLLQLNELLQHGAVRRVQLAEGIELERPEQPFFRAPVSGPVGDVVATGTASSTLLGVLDSGCPFAHADLRKSSGSGTRVVAIWNQQGTSGRSPPSMGYGDEFNEAVLSGLIARSTDVHGSVDEHSCYLAAGMEPLVRHVSHGAHSLGLLAAARRYTSRANARVPYTLHAGAASEADIAFVQFPRKVLDTPCPAAIERHALDGIRYLLQLARRRQAVERLLISFAYESWVGPHDGSTIFESAVQDLILRTADVQLQVQFIAGNSGANDVHWRLANDSDQALSKQRTVGGFDLQVPPDSQAPAFIEIWVPSGGPDDLSLTLTPPDGIPYEALGWGRAVAWPSAQKASVCAIMTGNSTFGAAGRLILLRLAPTRTFDLSRPMAPHGVWQVRLESARDLAGIEAFVGRAPGTLGAPIRGRQIVMLSRDRKRQREDRCGTLNGHSCHLKAVVATSCVAQDSVYGSTGSGFTAGHAAPYAGFGPTRGGRVGPSYGVQVEHGTYHVGTMGIGNRSATTFRLTGTSVAGPLGARLLLDGQAPSNSPAYPDSIAEIGTEQYDPEP